MSSDGTARLPDDRHHDHIVIAKAVVSLVRAAMLRA
jgi:hypothetical protein